jgi:hypothetical protein
MLEALILLPSPFGGEKALAFEDPTLVQEQRRGRTMGVLKTSVIPSCLEKILPLSPPLKGETQGLLRSLEKTPLNKFTPLKNMT